MSGRVAGGRDAAAQPQAPRDGASPILSTQKLACTHPSPDLEEKRGRGLILPQHSPSPSPART